MQEAHHRQTNSYVIQFWTSFSAALALAPWLLELVCHALVCLDLLSQSFVLHLLLVQCQASQKWHVWQLRCTDHIWQPCC